MGFKSPSAAQREVELLITKAHTAVTEDRKREVIDLELARLDVLQNSVWGMAISGDLKAVDSVLKIMSHRARILNLGDDTGVGTVNTIVVTGEEYVETLKGLAK